MFPVLLHRYEAQTMDAGMEPRIDVIEIIYFDRRMLRIPWIQKVSNEEVLTLG